LDRPLATRDLPLFPYTTLFRSLGKPDAVELYDTFINFPDPEGLYYVGRSYVRIGALEQAITLIDKSERTGFFCYPFFVRDSWLRSEEHTSELQSRGHLVCRLLL